MRVRRVPGLPGAPRGGPGPGGPGAGRARRSSAACWQRSRDRKIENLSKGFRQRTALAGALVHQPPVLILDEPTVGLDPMQIIKIRETIRTLGRDRAVLLSTHILPEVDAVCDRVLIIDRGRIVAEGTPAELRAKLAGTPVVRASFGAPSPRATALANAARRDLRAKTAGETGETRDPARMRRRSRSVARTIFRLAVAKGWVLRELARECRRSRTSSSA